jgi:hypothetical protein
LGSSQQAHVTPASRELSDFKERQVANNTLGESGNDNICLTKARPTPRLQPVMKIEISLNAAIVNQQFICYAMFLHARTCPYHMRFSLVNSLWLTFALSAPEMENAGIIRVRRFFGKPKKNDVF